MTAAEVRDARLRLGLSAAKLAIELGLGAHGIRTVQRWESGAIRITERTERQIKSLLRQQEYLTKNEKG
jgi:DNA-binding transcriptional regulator YiaG